MHLATLLQYNNEGLFILRLALAAIFIHHGLPKLRQHQAMGKGMGMPAALVFILGLVETLSGVGLALGVYTQLAALLLGLVMLGALKMKIFKWKTPFAASNATGWEFDLILLAAAAAILFTGGGGIGI